MPRYSRVGNKSVNLPPLRRRLMCYTQLAVNVIQPSWHPRSSIRSPQSPSHPSLTHNRQWSFHPLPNLSHNLVLLQPDIRHLNFTALRDAGYRAAIFDKDNCLVSYPPSYFLPLRALTPSHPTL
jgi:hypothetical protein